MPLAMRLPKLRGNTSRDAMPIGPFRTYSQPVNIRDLDRFEAGRGGHARVAEGEGPDPLDPQGRQAARRRRALQEAHRHRPRRLGDRAREDRGRGRNADAPQGAEGEEAAQDRSACAERLVKRRPKVRMPRSAADVQDEEAAAEADPRQPMTDERRPRPSECRTERRMLSWLANAWRVPELRRRVLFTAAILAAYRFGSWIPAPGVDAQSLSEPLQRRRARPAQPLQRRRARALLDLRARDHAVRHGVDRDPAPDRCRAEARAAEARGRVGLRQDHAVHPLSRRS